MLTDEIVRFREADMGNAEMSTVGLMVQLKLTNLRNIISFLILGQTICSSSPVFSSCKMQCLHNFLPKLERQAKSNPDSTYLLQNFKNRQPTRAVLNLNMYSRNEELEAF